MFSRRRRFDHPLRARLPLLVVIGLMILLHLAQVVFSPDPETLEELLASLQNPSWDDPWMCTPAKVVAALHEVRQGHFSYAVIQPLLSTFTCNFLHADFGHLLNNLLFFWIFGALCHELLGTRWLFTILVATAFGASIVQILTDTDSPIPSLGASGMVTGLEGAYLGLATRWRLPNPFVWPIANPIPPMNLVIAALIGISFDVHSILSHSQATIAFGAHVGGFVTGILLTALFAPKPRAAVSRH